ncbi:MAG: hypothetical protein U9N84_08005 [Actinomycetota bacterium]|nr:hypothetical protein [Actinomycetota bacterium]
MNINQPVVIVGIGEIGSVFGRGLLRAGHPVVPVVREAPAAAIAADIPDPLLTMVTVGEADLDATLESLPYQWRGNTALVQNELLPCNWEQHGLENPTIAVVWFEKKSGRDFKVLIPTPVYGPGTKLLTAALNSIGIAAFAVADDNELLYELVRKNLYILTANIGGLMTRDTVHDLWYNHRSLAEEVAADVFQIQTWLADAELDKETLMAGMVEAFDADPEHGATGRSAPTRLARALAHADQAGLPVPSLRAIAAQLA